MRVGGTVANSSSSTGTVLPLGDTVFQSTKEEETGGKTGIGPGPAKATPNRTPTGSKAMSTTIPLVVPPSCCVYHFSPKNNSVLSLTNF